MARIMIVEDEPITAADLEQKVLGSGHEVSAWVDTGEEAVDRAKLLSPDLILMDIRLRGAMSGIEAAQHIRAHSGVPIVFLTAFADQETVTRACKTEPFGYLLKPFSERAVATTVQVALARAGAERAQRERERWMSTGLRSAGDALIAVDESGAVRFMNEQAQALLDVQEQQALGKDARSLVRFAEQRPLDRTHPLDLVLHEGRVTTCSRRRLLSATGESRGLVSYSAAPVLGAHGTAGAVLVMREQPPEDAPQLERLDALRTLSVQLSHEINNPLSYNLGALHLALRELDKVRATRVLAGVADDVALREREQQLLRIEALLQDAEEGAGRAAGVLRELASFPLSERDLAPLHVSELIELAMGLSGIDIAARVRVLGQTDSVPMIRGNKWQLARVLVYALQSSVETLAARGAADQTVDLCVGLDARGWVEIRALARRSSQSPPTPPVERRQCSLDDVPRPTSVGMTVAQQVVESHAGSLVLRDQPDVRELVFQLPPLRLSRITALAEPSSQRGSVLVIDDEPSMGTVLELSLQPAHDVTALQSATSALALLERGETFDVILCDLAMPDMNGQQFYQRLCATRPELAARVFFMSAGATTERGTDFLPELEGRLIEKPFRTEQLLALVAERVRARRPPPSGQRLPVSP
jgi:CheY-like chemotaxis protein